MMCYLKMSKLGRKRQEPSSRSKISLCCQDCNNSCKAVKNLLWHWRNESADTEVIGWSRWLLLQISGEQNLPGVCPSGSSSPWTFLFWGLEWREGSSTPLNTTIHDEVSELKSKYFHWQKVSSKENHLSKCLFHPSSPFQLKRGEFMVVRRGLLSQCRCVDKRLLSAFGVSLKRTEGLASKHFKQREWGKEKGNKNE